MARMGFGRQTFAKPRNVLFIIVFLVCAPIAAVAAPLRMGGVLAVALVPMAAICAWAIWKDRRRSKLRFVDKLVVDDKAIRYSEFSHRTETMDWSEIDRVVYYFGPPDFPDPLVGYAPDREWQFYRHGRSIYVPDLGDHSRELAQWCGRKLPGFRADLLDQARTSIEQKSWVLWQRTGQPA